MNRRDTDGFLACLQPEVVWEESGDVLPGLRGIYRGRAEVREWFEEAFLELWGQADVGLEALDRAGQGVPKRGRA